MEFIKGQQVWKKKIMSQHFGNSPLMNFKRTYLMDLALTLGYWGTWLPHKTFCSYFAKNA